MAEEAELNRLLNDLVNILDEKSRKGMRNKKYSGYQTEIEKIRHIPRIIDKLAEMQFILGQNRLLDNIRKSIDKSRQMDINNLKNRINILYPEFNKYSLVSSEFPFDPLEGQILKKFLIYTMTRLKEGLRIVNINKYYSLFPTDPDDIDVGVEFDRIKNQVENRNSNFYKFKDRLEFLKGRSSGKKKKHYQTLIEYLENLERFADNYRNKPVRTRNETEFELNHIMRINQNLYRNLIRLKETHPDRFIHLFRILLNLPNKNQVYRYPNVEDTIAFLDCLYERELRIQRMLGRGT